MRLASCYSYELLFWLTITIYIESRVLCRLYMILKGECSVDFIKGECCLYMQRKKKSLLWMK